MPLAVLHRMNAKVEMSPNKTSLKGVIIFYSLLKMYEDLKSQLCM